MISGVCAHKRRSTCKAFPGWAVWCELVNEWLGAGSISGQRGLQEISWTPAFARCCFSNYFSENMHHSCMIHHLIGLFWYLSPLLYWDWQCLNVAFVYLFACVCGEWEITGSPRVKSNRLNFSVIVSVIFCMAAFVRVGIYLFIIYIYFFGKYIFSLFLCVTALMTLSSTADAHFPMRGNKKNQNWTELKLQLLAECLFSIWKAAIKHSDGELFVEWLALQFPLCSS